MNFKYRVVSIIVCGALLAVPGAPDGGCCAALRQSPRRRRRRAAAAAPAATPPAPADAPPPRPPDAPPPELKTLDQEVQGLKKDVIDLNKDLFVLRGRTAVSRQYAGRALRLDGRRHVFRLGFGDRQDRQQGSEELSVHGARGGRPAQGRRAADLSGQFEGRQARTGGVLHRQGSGRARLQARRHDQVRQGRRRQVFGTQDHGPCSQASA